jgi:hypothetical protein
MPDGVENKDKMLKAFNSINALAEGCGDIIGEDENSGFKELFLIWASFGGENSEIFAPERKLLRAIDMHVSQGGEKSTIANCYLFSDVFVGGTLVDSPNGTSRRILFMFPIGDIVVKYDGSSPTFSIIYAPDGSDIVRYIFIYILAY